MLGSGRSGMLEALEGTFDKPRDGNVNSAIGVVPIVGQATILCARH
jgi:hypothetical protein